MQNDRPLNNARIQTALDVFKETCALYDLVGCVTFADKDEMGFAYSVCATWNANVPDDTVPLGWRMRARSDELGDDRAHELLTGTAWTWGVLLDFGRQTHVWGQDLMRLLRKAGVRVQHRPFGGRALPRLTSEPPR